MAYFLADLMAYHPSGHHHLCRTGAWRRWAVRGGAKRCGAVRGGARWRETVQNDLQRCDAMWGGAIRCGSVRGGAGRCGPHHAAVVARGVGEEPASGRLQAGGRHRCAVFAHKVHLLRLVRCGRALEQVRQQRLRVEGFRVNGLIHGLVNGLVNGLARCGSGSLRYGHSR